MNASDAMEDQAAALDRAERAAAMGSWEWVPATNEIVWSDNCFRIFGRKPRSFEPSLTYIRSRVHPADLDAFDAGADDVRRGVDTEFGYRIVRDDGIVDLRAKVAIVTDREGEPRRVVGSVQDITAERQVARALAVRVAVSKALGNWPDFAEGSTTLLASLAAAMRTCFGVFWAPNGSTLVPVATWCSSDGAALATLRAVTLEARPGPGSATLGEAWQTGRTIVANDPIAATRERQTALTEAGVKAVIAIPATQDGVSLAVLEFFSSEPISAKDHLGAALTGVGGELGYFLSHRSGELVPPALTPRETEVLQLAARAYTAAEIAAELHVTPSTIKRHFEDAYARLGVRDRAAAVGEAMRRGLIG